MPWTRPKLTGIKRASPTQKRQWAHVANSMLATCLKEGASQAICEGRAVRAANAAVGTPAAQSPHPFHEIVVHFSPTVTRREWLDDREYLVARVVPIVEGVLNDFFISADEIAACLDSWSDLPLPVGHPKNAYGEYISGKSRAMVAQSVGRFFEPMMDGPRLVGEAWLDIAKCTRLGGEAAEVLRRVEANEIVEVSTAFYPQTVFQQGVFNGTSYRGVHRNLCPNHLALLPNSIGACHAGMGCGIRAAEAEPPCACVGACTCEEGEASMDLDADVKHPGKLRQALRTLFAFANSPDPEEEEETPEQPAPAEDEPTRHDARKPRQEEETPLGEAGERVVIQQRQPEQLTALKGARMLTKPELITRLVAHKHTGWTEEDRPMLQALRRADAGTDARRG